MYEEVFLLKLGEVVLKGLNRRRLEDLLVKNVKTALRGCGKTLVRESQSTIFVEFEEEDPDLDRAQIALKKVFGIMNLTRAYRGSYDWETLKQQTAEYVAPALMRAKTFMPGRVPAV